MSGFVPEILMYRFIYLPKDCLYYFLEVTMTGSQSKSLTIMF